MARFKGVASGALTTGRVSPTKYFLRSSIPNTLPSKCSCAPAIVSS